jgi:hypothetical protein
MPRPRLSDARWSELNERRLDLIDRAIAKTITQPETAVLERLQQIADAQFPAPPAPNEAPTGLSIAERVAIVARWLLLGETPCGPSIDILEIISACNAPASRESIEQELLVARSRVEASRRALAEEAGRYGAIKGAWLLDGEPWLETPQCASFDWAETPPPVAIVPAAASTRRTRQPSIRGCAGGGVDP